MLSDSVQHAEKFLGCLLLLAVSHLMCLLYKFLQHFSLLNHPVLVVNLPIVEFLLSPFFNWSMHLEWAQECISGTVGQYHEISLLCLVMYV
jgi:hypothetical protein